MKKANNYKAVVTDLDGTLLNEDHKLSEYTIDVVNKVIEKGIKFFIATGRNYNQAKYVMDDLGIKIPLITANGTLIYDENGNVLKEELIPQEDIEAIIDIDYKKYDKKILRHAYSGEEWILGKGDLEILLANDKYGFQHPPVEVLDEETKNKKIHKIFFIGKSEILKELEKEVREKISEQISVIYVSNTCMELFSKNANKANAAKYLLKKEKIKPSETVSFGDGENDFELLTEMGKGFVMANAIDRLKDKLPEDFEKADSNSENGEAKKLEELFLK